MIHCTQQIEMDSIETKWAGDAVTPRPRWKKGSSPMTTNNTTYNGWTNYATWRVNLEICDDYLNSLIADDHHGYIERYESIADLADHLKDVADDAVSNYGAITDSLALDYARSFLEDVNFYEIAEHWTDQLVEPEA